MRTLGYHGGIQAKTFFANQPIFKRHFEILTWEPMGQPNMCCHLVMWISRTQLIIEWNNNNNYIIIIIIIYSFVYIPVHSGIHTYIHTYMYLFIHTHICIPLQHWPEKGYSVPENIDSNSVHWPIAKRNGQKFGNRGPTVHILHMESTFDAWFLEFGLRSFDALCKTFQNIVVYRVFSSSRTSRDVGLLFNLFFSCHLQPWRKAPLACTLKSFI